MAFEPLATNLSDGTLSAFLKAPISGDLQQVPGVGQKTAEKLEAAGVSNTFQLFGKYLSLKAGSVKQHHSAMYEWLVEIGISTHRNTIVLALAQRMDVTFPGIFDLKYYAAAARGDEEGGARSIDASGGGGKSGGKGGKA